MSSLPPRAHLSVRSTAPREDLGRLPYTPATGFRAINWRHVGTAMAVYFAARAISTLMMRSIAADLPSDPAYREIASNWDGQWYKSIATHGYRTTTSLFEPVPQQNEIAFFPVYPLLCRLVSAALGTSFETAAVTVSLTAGAVASVLLFTWLVRTQSVWAAGAAVTVLSFFPSAPALQIAYTEGIAALLVVAALRALDSRRYVLLSVLIVVLAFTRPILPPLALLLGVHVVSVWRQTGRPRLGSPELRPALLVLATAAVGCVAWPLTAWWMTGVPQAYFATMGTWVRYGGIKGGWVGGLWEAGIPAAAVLVGGILALLVALRVRRALEGTAPPLIHQWGAVYALFILLSTTISTSVFRYALLLLAPVDWTPLSKVRRLRWWVLAAVVLVELALQYLWLKAYVVIERSGGFQSPP